MRQNHENKETHVRLCTHGTHTELPRILKIYASVTEVFHGNHDNSDVGWGPMGYILMCRLFMKSTFCSDVFTLPHCIVKPLIKHRVLFVISTLSGYIQSIAKVNCLSAEPCYTMYTRVCHPRIYQMMEYCQMSHILFPKDPRDLILSCSSDKKIKCVHTLPLQNLTIPERGFPG